MKVHDMQRNFMIKLRQFVEEPEVESDDIDYYLNRAQESFIKEQHFIIRDNYRNQQVGNINVQRAIENLRTLVRTVEEKPTDYFRLPNSIYIDLSKDGYTEAGGVFTATVTVGDTSISVDDSSLFSEGNAIYTLVSGSYNFIGTVQSIPNNTTLNLFGQAASAATNGEDIYVSQPFTGKEYAYYLRSQIELAGSTLNCRIIDPTMLGKFTKTKYNKPLFREPAVLIEGDLLIAIYPSEVLFSDIDSFELTYLTYPNEISIANDVDCQLPVHTHNEVIDQAVEFKIQDLQRARSLGIDKNVEAPPMPREKSS